METPALPSLAPLPVLLLFGAAVTLASPKPSFGQGSRTADRNIQARDFTATFGVNVHFHENGYQDVRAIARALKFIGFSRVRTTCADAADVSAWRTLAARVAVDSASALKADVLITGYRNAPDVTFKSQQAFVRQIAGVIETLEGPNEINNYGVGSGTHGPFDTADRTADFAGNYAAWAEALARWKRGTPSLAGVTLLAPSIASGDPKDYARLPNVSAYVRAGNFHFYAGNGRQPSGFGGGNFAAIHGWYQAAATPGKPVAVTEWGQTTAGKPGQGGCDEATQAKYILNQLFDAAAEGVSRAYIYQLMDDTPDGDPTGNGGTEAHFGLFDYRWRAKPAARALANIKTLLADSSARFTAHVPAYQVRGIKTSGAAGSSLSISKSDGSTFIVVWNEPRIWDPDANTAVTPPAERVTLELGGRYAYRVYDPLIGPQPITAGTGSRVTISLLGSPLMIKAIPTAASKRLINPNSRAIL